MFKKEKFEEFIYNIKYMLKNLRKVLTLKRILIIFGVLVIVAGGAVLLKRMNRAKPEDSPLYSKSELNIGIVTGTAFAVSEEGSITGFERELIEKIVSDLFPGPEVRIIEVLSQEASYKLRTEEIDIAIGMFTSGPVKTQGLSLSTPYFTDTIYAYVPKHGKYEDLFSLTNKRVRVLSSDITKSSVNSMFKKLGVTVDLHLCSSFDEGIESLIREDCVAIVAPKNMVPDDIGLKNIDEPVGQVSYRIMIWKDKSATLEVLNREIEALKSSGFIDELCEKYRISAS